LTPVVNAKDDDHVITTVHVPVVPLVKNPELLVEPVPIVAEHPEIAGAPVFPEISLIETLPLAVAVVPPTH
jgi:hypothetical protein